VLKGPSNPLAPVDSPELPQQLLRPLIEDRWKRELRLDDEIAAAAVARLHAALAQAKPLARLRTGRDPNTRRTINRRHIDFRAERSLVDANLENHMKIVPLPSEDRMGPHLDRHEEIARLAAVAPGMPLPGHADPRAIGQARRNVDGNALGV
jgi:hypothetical protein